MKEKVFYIQIQDEEEDISVCEKLKKAIVSNDFLSFVEPKDMVAIKTHFGEKGSNGFVRPLYFKMLGDILKQKEGLPFLTDTQTLYVGNRSNSVDHILQAYKHGFTFENTGLPIIMSDGLYGDEAIMVKIPGRIYREVRIASMIVKSQAMVVVSHFTGHLATGFGAAIKNIGMGCSSRKGKLSQHSTAKPSIKKNKCTGCEVCIKWCPSSAISMSDGKADIDSNICIGCAECIAVCRFGAVGFTWSETNKQLQKKMAEYALGVVNTKKDKVLYINFLNRITKDCDCMGEFVKIVSDIGILLSFDPVAIDAASVDLVEEKSGDTLPRMAYNVPYKVQIEYASELGLGNLDYELIAL